MLRNMFIFYQLPHLVIVSVNENYVNNINIPVLRLDHVNCFSIPTHLKCGLCGGRLRRHTVILGCICVVCQHFKTSDKMDNFFCCCLLGMRAFARQTGTGKTNVL